MVCGREWAVQTKCFPYGHSRRRHRSTVNQFMHASLTRGRHIIRNTTTLSGAFFSTHTICQRSCYPSSVLCTRTLLQHSGCTGRHVRSFPSPVVFTRAVCCPAHYIISALTWPFTWPWASANFRGKHQGGHLQA